MLERTETNKLELDCKEKYYMSLNVIEICFLKQYVSTLENNFVFSFCRLAESFKKARRLIKFVSGFYTILAHSYPDGVDKSSSLVP